MSDAGLFSIPAPHFPGALTLPQGDPVLELRLGAVLHATVLDFLDNGEVLLGMLGARVRVRTEVPVQPGQELVLQVARESTTERVELRLVEAPEAVRGPLATFARAEPGVTALARSLPRLARALFPAPVDPQAPPTAPEIRTLFANLGVGFERRMLELADKPSRELPAAVAELRANLRSIGGDLVWAEPGPKIEMAGAEEPREGRVELARDADLWRGEQVVRAQAGLPLVFPLPPTTWLREGRLFLQPDTDGQDEPARPDAEGRPFTIVFLLDLVVLGPLRIDATMVGGDVSLRFTCTREHSVVRIRDALPDLATALGEARLRLTSSSVHLRHDGHLPVLDLLPPATEGEGVIDVRA